MFGRGIEGAAALAGKPIKAVAPDLVAFQPAVAGKARHRGAHHAAVDVEHLEKFQQRSKPDRTAPRQDGVAEHRHRDRAGTRGLAFKLADNTGEGWRHRIWHTRFLTRRQRPIMPVLAFTGSGRDKPAYASRCGRTASSRLPAVRAGRR